MGEISLVQFVSHNNEEMPWAFKPSEDNIQIKTGKYHTATFYVKNTTNKRMVAQAMYQALHLQTQLHT